MKKTVLCGIDRLDEHNHLFENKRLGLITNPTGVNRKLIPTVDLLNHRFNLVCLMSPEHGVRGDLQAGDAVSSYTDSKTGLPVYSLYGDSCHISAEVLSKIDTVVFDIQDVGARFYTYLYTLTYAMEDCAKAGKTVVVLDRPNPIGGESVSGTVLDMQFRSFVGRYEIATRYGLTIGEYANYINSKYNIDCDLQIVKLENWSRELFYDDTDLVWIAPSPNLPTIDSCLCYIGTCLFEGTNLSEGRGTTKPFEVFGAPWLNPTTIIKGVSGDGFILRETYFKPTFSKHKDELCAGIQIHITDRTRFDSFTLGIKLIDTIRKTHSDFGFLPPTVKSSNCFIDLLLGSNSLRSDTFDSTDFFEKQNAKLTQYQQSIEPFKLY